MDLQEYRREYGASDRIEGVTQIRSYPGGKTLLELDDRRGVVVLENVKDISLDKSEEIFVVVLTKNFGKSIQPENYEGETVLSSDGGMSLIFENGNLRSGGGVR